MPQTATRRTMGILITAQTLYYCGISVDLSVTGLAGLRLAPVPALATLPFALISVGSWLATYPASAFMRRRGRKAGFLVGSLAAALGGALSATALLTHRFFLFCLGIALVGIYQAFASYYRYAAADLHPVADRARAISRVLSGGVIAAVAGPFIAVRIKDLLPVPFAACYVLVTVLALLSTGVLALLAVGAAQSPIGDAPDEPYDAPPRSLPTIVRQPVFLAGALGAGVGFGVMSLLMTGAPIAAVHAGRTVDQGATVIQWHMVGMYATAFVAGPLTRRIGVGPTLVLGTLVSASGALTAAGGTSETVFMTALALIGIGWNLMYVTGSALIAASYRPTERATPQGLGELTTLGASALGSLGAGPLLAWLGWHDIALGCLPVLGVSLAATGWYLVTTAASPRAG